MPVSSSAALVLLSVTRCGPSDLPPEVCHRDAAHGRGDGSRRQDLTTEPELGGGSGAPPSLQMSRRTTPPRLLIRRKRGHALGVGRRVSSGAVGPVLVEGGLLGHEIGEDRPESTPPVIVGPTEASVNTLLPASLRRLGVNPLQDRGGRSLRDRSVASGEVWRNTNRRGRPFQRVLLQEPKIA